MQTRIEELEGVLGEVLATLPHFAQQSTTYHELYIKVWNVLDPPLQVRLFKICQWTYSGVERGPGPGWMCKHGFFMATLTPRSLTNLEGYHGDYLRRED